jgi:ABC-type multidrug transport system ATPase subunit
MACNIYLILFLDEPRANLDHEASKTVREFILELEQEKRTISLTHAGRS